MALLTPFCPHESTWIIDDVVLLKGAVHPISVGAGRVWLARLDRLTTQSWIVQLTKYCLFLLYPFMIIAEEISFPIKSSSYDVPSIILKYSIFALEAIIASIIAAQSPLHCHFCITWFHWNAIELCNYCTKVNRVLPPLAYSKLTAW